MSTPNGQLSDLTIKAAELAYLNNIIENMPTKFGYPLVQFFSQIAQLRAQEKTKESETGEVLKEKEIPNSPYPPTKTAA